MNARDMEDIMMNSRENLREWRADYMRQYTEPVRKTLIDLTARQLKSLPPELLAVSRQRMPEQWKVLDREFDYNETVNAGRRRKVEGDPSFIRGNLPQFTTFQDTGPANYYPVPRNRGR